MPAKILKARPEGVDYVIQIHLDTARTVQPMKPMTDPLGDPLTDARGAKLMVEDGPPVPDPAWVSETRFGLDLSPDYCVQEARRLARAALDQRTAAGEPDLQAAHGDEGKEITL
jgi:hypothetical protein